MTLYTIRANATAHPEDSVLQFNTDLVRVGGFLSTDDFTPTENSPADMNVLIGVGRAYVKGGSTNTYPARNTTSYSQTISANSSGNPRIDTIVLYIDLSVTSPSSDASDVAKIIAVEGTPSASPVEPDDTAIQTAVGSGNPYQKIANVNVSSGATAINTADITDKRKLAYIKTTAPVEVNTYASTVTFDMSKTNKHEVTLTGNPTLAVTNDRIGEPFLITLIQDGTGSRTVTWWANINWAGGSAPDLTTTANHKDSFMFIKRSGSYDGYLAGLDIG